MNEDYLWNKTGEDSEIEKLENALQTLRYRRTPAPLILLKTPIGKKSSFRFFPLAAAVTACLVFALLASGLWLQNYSHQTLDIAKDAVQSQSIAQSAAESARDFPAAAASSAGNRQRVGKTSAAKRAIKKNRQSRRADVQASSRAAARKTGKVNPANVLSEEEKYAYDQLLTALAITNSQLKLVRDKIQNN